jgi:archaellum component FlaC
MAIQPIDLQTLFTQMDKVARTQTAQREGLAVQQAIHGAHLQRKTEEQIEAVNEVQNTGDDGVEKTKDKEAQGHDGSGGKKKEHESLEKKLQAPYISDPRLGRNIDISL